MKRGPGTCRAQPAGGRGAHVQGPPPLQAPLPSVQPRNSKGPGPRSARSPSAHPRLLSSVTCFLPPPQGTACCLLSNSRQAPARLTRPAPPLWDGQTTTSPATPGPLPSLSFLSHPLSIPGCHGEFLGACGYSSIIANRCNLLCDFYLIMSRLLQNWCEGWSQGIDP